MKTIRICILLALLLMVELLLCCNSVERRPNFSYDRQDIADMIATHDTTILYFMTSWCQASQNDFNNNMKPYLNNASETKAIVLVCIGDIEQVSSLENMSQHVLICNASSRHPLLDKRFINRECKELLSGYKRVNYVPVGVVCNRNGEILNWNTNEELDRTYGFLYPYLMQSH